MLRINERTFARTKIYINEFVWSVVMHRSMCSVCTVHILKTPVNQDKQNKCMDKKSNNKKRNPYKLHSIHKQIKPRMQLAWCCLSLDSFLCRIRRVLCLIFQPNVKHYENNQRINEEKKSEKEKPNYKQHRWKSQ